MKNLSAHSRVLRLILATRRRIKWLRILSWWSVLLGLLPLGLLLVLAIEHLGSHEPAFRLALRQWLLLGFPAWCLLMLLPPFVELLPLRRRPGVYQVARLIGWGGEDLRDRLLNGVQVVEAGRSNVEGYDPELIAASLDQILPSLEGVETRKVLPFRMLRRGLAWGGGLCAACLALFLAGGADSRLAAQRLVDPLRDFRPAPPFTLELSADSTVVVRGEELNFCVRPVGNRIPGELRLFSERLPERTEPSAVTAPDGPRRSWPLLVRRGRAELSGLKIQGPTRFWAQAGVTTLGRTRDIHSDTLVVEVLDPPRLEDFHVGVRPPYYTNLPRRELEPGTGDLVCPVGSLIQVGGRVSETLARAELLIQGPRGIRRTDLLEDNPGLLATEPPPESRPEFLAEFRARRDGAWWIELSDPEGLDNRSPVKHSLKVIPDRPPNLRMLSPESLESRLERDLRLQIVALAEDDYGFSSLRMVHKTVSSVLRSLFEAPDPAALSEPPADWAQRDLELQSLGSPRRAALEWEWNLAEEGLLPDDELYFYLELFDNDGWHGPKAVRTALYRVKVPGVEELFAEVEEDQSELMEEAGEILEETRRNRERIREFQEELKRDPEMNWERRQKMKQVLKRQEKLIERAAEVGERLERLERKMERNELFSEELREKLRHLKEVLNEVIDPELLERLRKAAEEARKKPADQDRRAQARDLEELLRQMEEQLDRFLAVLEQLRLEQRLEELANRAEELLERQREVNRQDEEAAREGRPSERERNRAAAQERRLEQDAEQLRRDLDSLEEEFGDRESFPQEQVDRAAGHMDEQEIPPDMGRMAQQLKAGDSASQESGERLDQDLNMLAEMLQQALRNSRQQAMEQLSRDIDRVCQELLVISLSQEAVDGEVKTLTRRSARVPELAEHTVENRLGVSASADALMDLIRRSFHIPKSAMTSLGDALSNLDRMLEHYHERRLGELGRRGPQVMGKVNRTILLLKQAQQQMRNSCSSTGFEELMEQLSQASSKQECLNGQCNKLLCNKPGQAQKPMSISFGEAQAQQSGIRQEVESIGEKLGEEGQPQTGDLGKIAGDMREVEKDLEDQVYTERTQRLQERILTRLLDAQRSIRRQDQSRKRESRTARVLQAPEPPALDLERRTEDLQRDLLRALEAGYSPDIEELIRDYFEALERAEAGP